MWDEITDPFPNATGCIIEVLWECISNPITLFTEHVITYQSWD